MLNLNISFNNAERQFHRLMTIILLMFTTLCAYPESHVARKTMDVEGMRRTFEAYSPAEQKRVRDAFAPYLKQLDDEIAKIPQYDRKRQQQVARLRTAYVHAASERSRWDAANGLFNAFKNLNCDSALHYATACFNLAQALDDRQLLVTSLLNKAQAALLGGYFREAHQYVEKIDESQCDQQQHVRYLQMAFNIEFEDGFYYPVHVMGHDVFNDRMQALYHKMEAIVPANSVELDDMRSKIAYHNRRYDEAVAHILLVLSKLPRNSARYAYTVGNLGYNYMGAKNYTAAMAYMVQSAILEIRQGSKEYPAMRKIGEILYTIGDIDRAYRFINIALDNSIAYNSKYRKVEVLSMYPRINEQLYKTIHRKNVIMGWGIGLLSTISALLVAAGFFLMRQRNQIKRQMSIIEQQVGQLSRKSEDMAHINSRLTEMSRIKDVVLGEQITATASQMEQMEKLRLSLDRRLKIHDYAGIAAILEGLKIRKNELFNNLDNLLLKLFPDFPAQFNALLREDSRERFAKGNALSPEMRIFALIRLGITKNDEIARCLNYSVYTIKSYKTRVLNASDLSSDDFYKKLSEIAFK